MDKTFSGFIPPKKNFFQMPNVWIDICSEIKNLAELKVVQYVLRHTWGYREYGITKTISVDEFMHGRRYKDGTRMDKGTGLSNHSVIDGLKAAIKHEFLLCEVDTSDLARVKKSYALKMATTPGEASSPPEDIAQGEEDTDSSEDASPLPVKHLHIGGEASSHRSEKDTLERHFRKTPKKDTYSDPETEQPIDVSATANADRTHTHNSFALSEENQVAAWHAPKEAHEQYNHNNNHGAAAGVYHPARDMAQGRTTPIQKPHTAPGETHTANRADARERVVSKWDSPDGQTNYVGKLWPDGSVTPDYERTESKPVEVPEIISKVRSAQHARWQKQLPSMLTEEGLSSAEQQSLHAHLAECPECTQLDQQRQAILAVIREQTGRAAELATSMASSPQARAKVAPKLEQEVLVARAAVPEMPSASARWCAETIVQIVEAKNKKYYREATRKKQLASAQRIIKDDLELTREQFVMAYDERDDDWWREHKGALHVNHMAEKDRVHEMLGRIEVRNAKKPSKSHQSKGSGPAMKDTGLVEWQDDQGNRRMMTYAEADTYGWNGGFGEYIQHTNYGKAAI